MSFFKILANIAVTILPIIFNTIVHLGSSSNRLLQTNLRLMKWTKLFFILAFAFGASQSYGQLVDQDSGLSASIPKTASETQVILQGLLDILENNPAYQGSTYKVQVFKLRKGIEVNMMTLSPKSDLNVSGFTYGIYYLRIMVNGQIVCTEQFFIQN